MITSNSNHALALAVIGSIRTSSSWKHAADDEKKKEERVSSKDILGSPYSPWDYLNIGGVYGSHRAGRATQMAKAVGNDVPFTVNRPGLSSGLGAALGATAGLGVGMASGQGPGLDWVVGAGAGGLLGAALSVLARQRRMAEIARNFDASDHREPKPLTDDSIPTMLLGGGMHQLGQAEAHRAIRDNVPYTPTVAGRLAGPAVAGSAAALHAALPGAGYGASSLANAIASARAADAVDPKPYKRLPF